MLSMKDSKFLKQRFGFHIPDMLSILAAKINSKLYFSINWWKRRDNPRFEKILTKKRGHPENLLALKSISIIWKGI